MVSDAFYQPKLNRPAPSAAQPLPGRTLSAPGKDLTFLQSDFERLRFREDVGHDAAPVPVHCHLWQWERFTVLEGELILTVERGRHRLLKGESLTVPPKVLHTYAPGLHDGVASPVLLDVEIWPARGVHQFFEAIYGYTREGRLPPRGARDAIALLALSHAHGFVLAGPPGIVMRGLAAMGAILAAVLRIEPWEPRYAARRSMALPEPILCIGDDLRR